MKFKSGDKVRRLAPNSKFKTGDIITVDIYYSNDSFSVKEDVGGPCHIDKYCKLVETETPEQLFEMMNEGIEAKDKLVKLNMLEQRYSENDSWSESKCSYRQFRLKPKKTFTPFAVNNNQWLVDLLNDGMVLKIGCERFSFDEIKNALTNLIEKNESLYMGMCSYTATKKGIYYRNHILPWEDASKILNALNHYNKG